MTVLGVDIGNTGVVAGLSLTFNPHSSRKGNDMGEAKRRMKNKTANSEIVVEGVIEHLQQGRDRNTHEISLGAAGIRTANNERFVVFAESEEPRRALLELYEGATATFVGRLFPTKNPKLNGIIVASALTPAGRDEIVVVATVKTIKRVLGANGETSFALAHVTTKEQRRLTVSSRGGEPMNALLNLMPGDIARFTGHFSPPFEEFPNIELRLVAPIERRGIAEPWRDEWFFVSRDRLSPGFRLRVAASRTRNGR
jgi:hypothetical protein